MTDNRATIDQVTAELAAAGAQAVVLFGSFARGQESAYSDIDLLALGHGEKRYDWRDERLVDVAWVPAEVARQQFTDPAAVGAAVRGWREARIQHDPSGVASSLQREALAWSWDRLDPGAADAWVAREMAGLAEEVFKLVAALEQRRFLAAAAQRNVLVLNLPGIVSVQHRLLYGSENRLWDMVAEELGPAWKDAQARAMGLNTLDFEETCRAALTLYRLAADDAQHAYDDQQRVIVSQACALAERV
ncbi:MAG: nucleotidyltransferase domain-containing protein [Anaerolineae bacterium]|nr:nucleotidyltransferase domain-containing protein [Anaerolineae bacterium]